MRQDATRSDVGAANSAPYVVRDASAALSLFRIPIRSAQSLVQGRALRALSVLPGQGLLGIAFLDQREGSLESHRQAALMVAAAGPRSAWLGWARGLVAVARHRIAFHVFQHPVGSEAARALGAGVFGLPSSVQGVEMRYEPRRVHCELVMHGRHVLTLSAPTGGAASLETTTLEALNCVAGSPQRTRGTCAGVGVTEGGRHVELLLGDHPLADRLRRLGLPKRPVRSIYVETLSARVEAPERMRAAR